MNPQPPSAEQRANNLIAQITGTHLITGLPYKSLEYCRAELTAIIRERDELKRKKAAETLELIGNRSRIKELIKQVNDIVSERDTFRAKAEVYDLIEKFGFERLAHYVCGLDEILAKVKEINK